MICKQCYVRQAGDYGVCSVCGDSNLSDMKHRTPVPGRPIQFLDINKALKMLKEKHTMAEDCPSHDEQREREAFIRALADAKDGGFVPIPPSMALAEAHQINVDARRNRGFVHIGRVEREALPSERPKTLREEEMKDFDVFSKQKKWKTEVRDFFSVAQDLIVGDRSSDYGSPVECWKKIAKAARQYTGANLGAVDCIRVMRAVKEVRQAYKPKRDNLVDLVNYAVIEQLLLDAEENTS